MRIDHVNNQKCCGHCKTFKDFENFNYSKSTWDQLRNTCKECLKSERESKREHMTEYNKKYWQKTKNIQKEKNKTWRENNKEKVKENMKKWLENNKEYKKQKDKEYRAEHYEQYKENLKKWKKAKYKAMKEENGEEFFKHKMKTNISIRIREILGQNKSEKCVKYVGCSIDELKAHIETTFTEGMTWENYGKWHIDHIIPCTAFDHSSEDQIKACWNFRNLQALWAKDNIQKSDKFTREDKEKYLSIFKHNDDHRRGEENLEGK
jgi:hypothetical protein